MFYLQSSLDVAYHISMRIYKLFNLSLFAQKWLYVSAILFFVHFEPMKCKY